MKPLDFAERLAFLMDLRGTNRHAMRVKIGVKNKDWLKDILDGTTENPRRDTIRKIAKALETTTAYLNFETDDPEISSVNQMSQNKHFGNDTALQNRVRLSDTQISQDMPVRGVKMGDFGDTHFSIMDEVVDQLPRPPGLAKARDAFALYISGSVMSPRYDHGDPVYINPAKPAAPGDDVLIELKGSAPRKCLLRQLMRLESDHIVVAQFNPPDPDIRIERSVIESILRVVPRKEL